MKRLFALALVIMLLGSSARAADLPIGGGIKKTPAPEATPAPEEINGAALVDPAARYARFVDSGDPAADWILRFLDSVNDEAALIADATAIRRVDHEVGADGKMNGEYTIDAFMSARGVVMLFDMSGLALDYSRAYVFAERAVYTRGDEVVFTSPLGFETQDAPISLDGTLFRYDPAEKLLAVRDGENGGFLILTDGGNGYVFEYVTDAQLRLTGLRFYQPDADGVVRLTKYSEISLVDAPALPQAVIDALAR